MKVVRDEDVDALAFKPVKSSPWGGVVETQAPAELALIERFARGLSPYSVGVVASGTKDREGFGTDDLDVTYPDRPEADVHDGVCMEDPLGQVVMTPAAFERMIARFLVAAMKGAQLASHPVVNTDTWRQLEADAKALTQRAYPQGFPADD